MSPISNQKKDLEKTENLDQKHMTCKDFKKLKAEKIITKLEKNRRTEHRNISVVVSNSTYSWFTQAIGGMLALKSKIRPAVNIQCREKPWLSWAKCKTCTVISKRQCIQCLHPLKVGCRCLVLFNAFNFFQTFLESKKKTCNRAIFSGREKIELRGKKLQASLSVACWLWIPEIPGNGHFQENLPRSVIYLKMAIFWPQRVGCYSLPTPKNTNRRLPTPGGQELSSFCQGGGFCRRGEGYKSLEEEVFTRIFPFKEVLTKKNAHQCTWVQQKKRSDQEREKPSPMQAST